MRTLLKITLIFLIVLSSGTAFSQTRELTFDDTHTVYYVPKGKMWLINFENIETQFRSNITIDKTFTLAVWDEVFKKGGHAKRSIFVTGSLQVKLKPGESLAITVDEDISTYTYVQSNGNLFQGEGFKKDCCPLLEEPRNWNEK